eukprot:gene29422-42860_t
MTTGDGGSSAAGTPTDGAVFCQQLTTQALVGSKEGRAFCDELAALVPVEQRVQIVEAAARRFDHSGRRKV